MSLKKKKKQKRTEIINRKVATREFFGKKPNRERGTSHYSSAESLESERNQNRSRRGSSYGKSDKEMTTQKGKLARLTARLRRALNLKETRAPLTTLVRRALNLKETRTDPEEAAEENSEMPGGCWPFKTTETNEQLAANIMTSPEPAQSTGVKDLNIITWNINGKPLADVAEILEKLVIQSNPKNIEIVPHVVFLQETRCKYVPEAKIIKNGIEWRVFYTQYNNTDKGVAILVNKSKFSKFRLISQEVDSNGRYVVVRCELVPGQEYTLVSVYNHQSDTKTLDLLTPYLQNNTVGRLVIGGDFNTTFGINDRAKELPDEESSESENSGESSLVQSTSSSQLVRYGPNEKNKQHGKIRVCVERFMRSLQLVDVWTGKNGYDRFDEKCFTYRKHQDNIDQKKDPENEMILSRLDYFFIPEERMCSVTRCEVLLWAGTYSQESREKTQEARENRATHFKDHSPLLLQMENKQTELADQFKQLRVEIDKPSQQCQNIHFPKNINKVEIEAALQSLKLRKIHSERDTEIERLKSNLESLIVNNSLLDMSHFTIEKGGIKYHFFKMEYLVFSTILAWRLQDWGLQDWGRKGRDKDPTVEVVNDEVEWNALKELIKEKMTLSNKETEASIKYHPCTNDFDIIENLLGGENEGIIKLYNGCPLSRTLRELIASWNDSITNARMLEICKNKTVGPGLSRRSQSDSKLRQLKIKPRKTLKCRSKKK